MDWCWSWNSNTLATWCEEMTHLKRPWCWERLRAGGEGDNRGRDGWMATPTRRSWVGWTPGAGDGQGGLECCSSWGHKESDTTEWLNWTETMVEVMKIMMTSLERSYAGTATLHTPNPAVGHCQPILVSESPGHSWASLGQSLMGSLFLSLGSWCAQVLFVPSKGLFSQSCVSSSSSLVGLMATSSKWARKSFSILQICFMKVKFF